MKSQFKFIVRIATSGDHKYATEITDEMASSAAKRGTGISRRTPEFAMKKMDEGHAVIVINSQNGEWMGFCYIELWQHKRYVANSGLIVSPKYRGIGISREIKSKLFELCRTKFPRAKLFSLTTSPAVMHINAELGYTVVSYSDIMKDELFLRGCDSWVNYYQLMHVNSHYVAMIFDPAYRPAKPSLIYMGKYLLKKLKKTAAQRPAAPKEVCYFPQ